MSQNEYVEVKFNIAVGNEVQSGGKPYFTGDANLRWSQMPEADAVLLQAGAIAPAFSQMLNAAADLGKKKFGV